MKFNYKFSILDRIQLLERWILVQSFAYYMLDENISSDFDYDLNARQLMALKKDYPEEFKSSRYHKYFYDYDSCDRSTHYVSGFDLLNRVRKEDNGLYRYLHLDAILALDLKKRRSIVE